MSITPGSAQQRLSSMQVLTRTIDSPNVSTQLQISPSTRQVWVGLRQNHHDGPATPGAAAPAPLPAEVVPGAHLAGT